MQTATWAVLEEENPGMASFGQERLDGKVACLATVRSDGRPRACPVTPIIGGGHLFIFVEPISPKVKDLTGSGEYCLHCAMNDSSGSSGEFLVTGTAVNIKDAGLRQLAESASSFKPSMRYLLFELNLNEVLATSYPGGRPKRTRWLFPATRVTPR